MNDEILGKIIGAADGSAGLKDRLFVKNLVKTNAEVARLFNEYLQTSREVHHIKPNECPVELMETLKINSGGKSDRSVWSDLYALIFTKPAYSFSVAVFSLFVIMSAVMMNRSQPEQYFSAAQIRTADDQAKKALVFVSSLFKQSSKTVTNDILLEHVSRPLNDGLNVVNELFIEGEKK